jgi:NAD(P)H dehydrogenase (quinone)
MSDKPILVYGATGMQGAAVARQLLQAGQRVRVLVRDPLKAERWREAGAEIVKGDYVDQVGLAAAHAGVDRVILHLPLQYDFDSYERYARNAIDAAKAAGVKLLVFNSSTQVPTGTSVKIFQVKNRVINYLRESRLPHIILRPAFYMENFLGPWAKPAIVQQGVIAYPLRADFKASWISHGDSASLSIAALNKPDLAGSAIDIGGPEALDGNEIAERFTRILGQPIQYVAITPDDFEKALVPALGPTGAFELADQFRWSATQPNAAVDMSVTAKRLSVQLTSLDEWIKQQDWSIPA